MDDCDPRTGWWNGGRACLQRQTILGVQVHVRSEGKYTEAARRGPLFEHLHPLIEEGQLATEFVDREASKELPFLGAQKVDGADHRAEHPASLDVRDQQPRRANPGDEAEIDEIVIAQVQLAHAARAFDDDHVESARQIGIRLEHFRAQFIGVRVVLARGQGPPHMAADDDLAHAVASSA